MALVRLAVSLLSQLRPPSPYSPATVRPQTWANGRACECVQRKVEADDSGCSVLRDVEPRNIERVHREHVAVRSIPLWRRPPP